MFKLFNKKSNPPKLHSYTFYLNEAQCVGDWYEYHVDAKSKNEALAVLVQYFFGKKQPDNVESKSGKLHIMQYDYTNSNLPEWFRNRISGCWLEDDNDKMLKFAKAHNIELRNDLE